MQRQRSEPATEEELERWRSEASAHTDVIQQELRIIRSSSAFGPR
jgi:hypothetical protein